MMIDLSLGPLDPTDPTDAYWSELMRAQRNRMLAESDWTQAHDDPTGKRDEWAVYRQQLRDFPARWTPGPIADFPDPPA